MTTVAKSTDELFWGKGLMLIASYGTIPTEELGMFEEGIEVTGSMTREDREAQEFYGPVQSRVTKRGLEIKGTLMQANVSVIERALGVTATGGKIEIGGGYDDPEAKVAIRLLGKLEDGKPIHLLIPRAVATGELKLNFQKEKGGNIPFGFRALDSTSFLYKLLFGSAVSTATLATGVCTRVQASPGNYISWVKVAGESAAADTLTSITAADLVDGELLRLQISAATMPITLTHSSTLVLKGAANLLLDNIGDWIDFVYSTDGTKWTELGHYLAY